MTWLILYIIGACVFGRGLTKEISVMEYICCCVMWPLFIVRKDYTHTGVNSCAVVVVVYSVAMIVMMVVTYHATTACLVVG